MTAQKKKAEDDYYCVSLPPSEWRHIDRWLGDNVSLTSVILTELNKIQKTYEKGKRSAVRIGIASIDTMIGGPYTPGNCFMLGVRKSGTILPSDSTSYMQQAWKETRRCLCLMLAEGSIPMHVA